MRLRLWLAGMVCMGRLGAAAVAEPRAAAEQLLTLLDQKQFAEAVAQFSPELKAVLPENKLRAAWHANWEQVGDFERRIETTCRRRGERDEVTITCESARGHHDVALTFEPDGRISGLFFRPTRAATLAEPPPYAPSAAWREVTEITIPSAGLSLPATLALPTRNGSWAGVVRDLRVSKKDEQAHRMRGGSTDGVRAKNAQPCTEIRR